jgi:hypothetical protein
VWKKPGSFLGKKLEDLLRILKFKLQTGKKRLKFKILS